MRKGGCKSNIREYEPEQVHKKLEIQSASIFTEIETDGERRNKQGTEQKKNWWLRNQIMKSLL